MVRFWKLLVFFSNIFTKTKKCCIIFVINHDRQVQALFTLIIVDDELYMLDILKKMLNWEEYGFTLSAVFSNPEEAMEYIDKNKVDVVLTDISMPGINGIDIAKHCFYHHTGTTVVFLSAFTDFEYARKGIQYKIFSYLTKPVSQSALIQVFSELYTKLNAGKFKTQFADKSANSVMRECFIRMISEDFDLKNISDTLNEVGINVVLNTAMFATISFKIENSAEYFAQTWKHGRVRFTEALEQIVNNEIFCGYSGLTYFYDTGFDVFLISRLHTDENNFRSFVSDYGENLESTLSDCLHIDVVSSDISIFPNSAVLKKYSSTHQGKKHNSQSDKELMFSQVAEYVGKHFNENISLNDAAAQVGFNPAYFSSLFKQYYGMNFVEYMTNIRIKAAKELLVGSNTKISTIPGLIGLSDLSHFSKSFKAATGYSPSEYRKKYGKL